MLMFAPITHALLHRPAPHAECCVFDDRSVAALGAIYAAIHALAPLDLYSRSYRKDPSSSKVIFGYDSLCVHTHSVARFYFSSGSAAVNAKDAELSLSTRCCRLCLLIVHRITVTLSRFQKQRESSMQIVE